MAKIQYTIRVLSREGDTAVVETEEKEAEKQFDKLAEKGFLMFAVEAPGKVPEQVRSFDPKQFEYVAVPQFAGG